jgi:ketopantoate reductase
MVLRAADIKKRLSVKALILKAGTIGWAYAWQLSLSGEDVTILVREGKKSTLEKTGIQFKCNDMRRGKPVMRESTCNPAIVDSIPKKHDYNSWSSIPKSN